MFPARLIGDGFQLRPLNILDFEALHAYLCLPEVYESTSADPWTEQDVKDFIELCVAGMDRGLWCRYGIVLPGGDAPVGDIGFGHVEHRDWRAEIGYHLAPGHWGRGLMPKAADVLIGWAFANGYHRIEATVLEGNERSARVLEKSGFQREATLRDYKWVRGEFRDFGLWARLNTA